MATSLRPRPAFPVCSGINVLCLFRKLAEITASGRVWMPPEMQAIFLLWLQAMRSSSVVCPASKCGIEHRRPLWIVRGSDPNRLGVLTRHLTRNWFFRSRLLDFSPINLRLEPPHFNVSGQLLSGSSRSLVHHTADQDIAWRTQPNRISKQSWHCDVKPVQVFIRTPTGALLSGNQHPDQTGLLALRNARSRDHEQPRSRAFF